jgi:hypothetical protein
MTAIRTMTIAKIAVLAAFAAVGLFTVIANSAADWEARACFHGDWPYWGEHIAPVGWVEKAWRGIVDHGKIFDTFTGVAFFVLLELSFVAFVAALSISFRPILLFAAVICLGIPLADLIHGLATQTMHECDRKGCETCLEIALLQLLLAPIAWLSLIVVAARRAWPARRCPAAADGR